MPMSEFSFSASVGKRAELHDERQFTPMNAEEFLSEKNFHWRKFSDSNDVDSFNKVYEPTVKKYNERQKRPYMKIGPDSSKPERQKSYYEGIIDGTFSFGSEKTGTKEQPFYEVVLQIGTV